MRNPIKYLTISITHLLVILILSIAHAEESNSLTETDNLLIDGQREYKNKCAVCHGSEGKGDGPYSFALIFKPSDLTQLTTRNNGNFPFIETYLMIDGREMIKYHGTRLMPVWGDRYKQQTWGAINPDYADTLVRGRILELILYIYTLQDSNEN